MIITMEFKVYRDNKLYEIKLNEKNTIDENMKIIVENPVEESDDVLREYGFSLEKFQSYQRAKRVAD